MQQQNQNIDLHSRECVFYDLCIVLRFTSAATKSPHGEKRLKNCDSWFLFPLSMSATLFFCLGFIKQVKYPTVYSELFPVFFFLRKYVKTTTVLYKSPISTTHTHLMWLNSGFKSLFTIMLTPQLAHKAGRLAGQSLWLSQWGHYVPPTAARAHNLLHCRPGGKDPMVLMGP